VTPPRVAALLALGLVGASWPDLSQAPVGSGAGSRDAAVIVAIEDYAYVEDVVGARQNGVDWYTWLIDAQGLSPDQVHLLRDGQAKDHRILDKVDLALDQVGEGATIWFVFIGHGAPSPDGRDGLLVGADADRSADGIQRRSLSQAALLAKLEGGHGGMPVVVIDACFSGQSTRGLPLVPGLQPLVPNYSLPGTEALVLSAGSADQFAGDLPGASRPAFSYLLLGALRGWGDRNGDAEVTAEEAVAYARGALLVTTPDRLQTPTVVAGPGGRVLGRGTESGPDLPALVIRGDQGQGELLEEVRSIAIPTVPPPESAPAPQAIDVEALAAARQAEVAPRVRDLQAEAADTWQALLPLLEAQAPEAPALLQRFLYRFGNARLEVEDAHGVQVFPVDVPQVREALVWQERLARLPDTGEPPEAFSVERMLVRSAEVQTCFSVEATAQGLPALREPVEIAIGLSPDGGVAEFAVSGRQWRKSSFAECLDAAVQTLVVPSFQGEQTVTYVIPLLP